MQVTDVPVDAIDTPDWNPNQMDPAMRSRLRRSLERFGNVCPLVVRPFGDARYETVGGAQRFTALREMGFESVPCVIVTADDAEARLLAQALITLSARTTSANVPKHFATSWNRCHRTRC